MHCIVSTSRAYEKETVKPPPRIARQIQENNYAILKEFSTFTENCKHWLRCPMGYGLLGKAKELSEL